MMNDDELMMEETDFSVENAPEQEHYELVVPPEFAGERLDIVITRLIGDISRVRAQNFIKQGHTLVNGQVSLLPRSGTGSCREMNLCDRHGKIPM